MIPPVGVDLFLNGGQEQYRWLVCTWPGDESFEFENEAWAGVDMTEEHDWVREMHSEDHFRHLFRPDNGSYGAEDPTACWLIENGIAPNQSFCVRFWNPRMVESWTDCGKEYDFEFEWELVAVEPLPKKVVLQEWEKWLDVCRQTLDLETLLWSPPR